MKNGYSALFLVAIVLSMAIVAQIDFIESADAVKAKGTKSMKYGMATKDKVCGDRLCTPEDFTSTGERKSLPALSDSSVSSHMAMAKMEMLFDLHRMQLVSAWDSMTDSEKSHMMKMFDRMYEMIQSMSLKDHMKHMSKMMGDQYHHGCSCGPDGCNCGDGMHGCFCGDMKHGMDCDCSEDGTCSCGEGCSCGDGDHGMACEADSEGCTCSEDGVCNCGEECNCASCH
jgi:hypothetical protein